MKTVSPDVCSFRRRCSILGVVIGDNLARAEVQKFLNPCGSQKMCASYRLVLTPPDGWVLDKDATASNNVQMLVPKGKTFADAEPLIYVQVFYHRDKQQPLADFARVSNERWMQDNHERQDFRAARCRARRTAKPGSCALPSKIRKSRSRPTRSARSASIPTMTATNSCSTW